MFQLTKLDVEAETMRSEISGREDATGKLLSAPMDLTSTMSKGRKKEC